MHLKNRLGYSFILIFSLILSGKVFAADLPVIGITEITSGVDVRNYREYKNSKAGTGLMRFLVNKGFKVNSQMPALS